MNLCQHFGLNRPPFEPTPCEDFFFAAPTHEEAYATLQYTVAAHKACTVVVGDSGYGKSLLARMLCSSAPAGTTVLAVQGIGQPEHATIAQLVSSNTNPDTGETPVAQETTLAAWKHQATGKRERLLVVVDNADELPEQSWRDVIALLAHEMHTSGFVDVVLFGAPKLLDILTQPELARLRRRVFRTCRLEPLTSSATRQYIRARISTAGGDGAKLFDEETIAQIYRLTRGNPALINQLCDNALIEAFSDNRRCITIADIGNAMYAILGGEFREAPAMAEATLHPTNSGANIAQSLPAPVTTYAATTRTPPSETPPSETDDGQAGRQLQRLEQRLATALRAVRQVRGADISRRMLTTAARVNRITGTAHTPESTTTATTAKA